MALLSPGRRYLCNSKLPLAIYREVAAHLRQVGTIEVGLLPQSSRQFDYEQSQVGGLWIQYGTETDDRTHQRVEQILQYYGDRYGNWQNTEEDAEEGRC